VNHEIFSLYLEGYDDSGIDEAGKYVLHEIKRKT
jgi:hypothetical protein